MQTSPNPVTGEQLRKWLFSLIILIPILYITLSHTSNYAYDNGYSSVSGRVINKQSSSTTDQNTNEVRSSPLPLNEASIQLYCDITTGKWSPGYNDRRNLHPQPPRNAEDNSNPSSKHSSSTSLFDSESTEQINLPETLSSSSSSLFSSSNTNPNILLSTMRIPNWYSLMDDHTRRQYGWLMKRRYYSESLLYSTEQTQNFSIDIEDNNIYPGLSIINEMLTTQEEGKTPISENNPPHPSVAWLWPFTELWPMPSYVGVGNKADKIQPKNSYSDVINKLKNLLGDRSYLQTSPIHTHLSSLNSSGRNGKHDYDSLHINLHNNETYIPYVTPLFLFRLATSTLNTLNPAELQTIRLGMQRSCSAMHTSWKGRLLETVNDFYGTYRDNGCDISCEYNTEINTCQYRTSSSNSIRKPNLPNTPIAVLSELVIHVDESDLLSLQSSKYTQIPLPYSAKDEGYTLHIDSTHILGSIKRSIDTVDVPIHSLEGHIHSSFLWGSLYGLETFNQVIENWGTERIGVPPKEKFSSPIYDILTGERIIPHTTDVMEMAKVAASHVSSKCVSQPPIQKDLYNQNTKFNDYTEPPIITLPLVILDQPWKRWRGLSLDTSRHWLPVESILTLLDGMLYTKMNVLHWHFSDAQSFPFLLQSHPEIAQKGAWATDKIYTVQDIRSIVKYAARRGIRVVPEMDSPAHAAALGKSHSEVLVDCRAIAGGNVKTMDLYSLDPSKEETFTLIREIFQELGDLFPDKYFHIGADEVAPECWASDSRVRNWSREKLKILYDALPSGFLKDTEATYTVLLAYFLHRIHALVVDMGKYAVSWEDSFEKLHATIRSRQQRRELWLKENYSPSFENDTTTYYNNNVNQPDNILNNLSKLSHSDWNMIGTKLFHILQTTSECIPPRTCSATSSGISSGTFSGIPRKLQESSNTNENNNLPSNFPTPIAKKGLKYLPQTIIEGWKCWVHHADDVVLAGAQTFVKELEMFHVQPETNIPIDFSNVFFNKNESSFLYYIENFGVLQAACWYLDYSSPWGDYYKHWPLPEHSRGISDVAILHERIQNLYVNYTNNLVKTTNKNDNINKNIINYPKVIFGKTPYLGGEAAMWTERVDASVLFCRVWPRAGIIGEITWSESLIYDRYARYYGQDPPFKTGSWLPRNDETDKLLSIFAAPRYLSFTRRLLRRQIPSSTVAVFDIQSSTESSLLFGFSDYSILKQPTDKFETDMFPFNGMCPGIEQTIQREKTRIIPLLPQLHEVSHDEINDPEFDDFVPVNNNQNPPLATNNIFVKENFTFLSWNIHDGGGSHNRYHEIISYLQTVDADVVGIVEANGWDTVTSRRLQNIDDNNNNLTNSSINHSKLMNTKLNSVSEHNTKNIDSLSKGKDEILYQEGKSLRDMPVLYGTSSTVSNNPRKLYDTIDTSAHLKQQTAGFRRRAASAGYTYSHILLLPSGYHLALLSARPMTIVYEDTEHFERGILVADISGIRFMLIHLHAQSAVERVHETQWIATLIKKYNDANIPLVIMGDFNTLSPFDALCHQALNIIDRLEGTTVPLYLRTKYLCHHDDDENCIHQVVSSGTDKNGILQVDYRPMMNILNALYDNFIPIDSTTTITDPIVPYYTVPSPNYLHPMYHLDFTLWYYNNFTLDNYTYYHDNDTNNTYFYPNICLASYPTSALGENADDAGDNGHVPLRIDHVVGNSYLYNLLLPYHIQCNIGNSKPNELVASHLLEISDHLPVICKIQ